MYSEQKKNELYKLVASRGLNPEEVITGQGTKTLAGEPGKREQCAITGPRWAIEGLKCVA